MRRAWQPMSTRTVSLDHEQLLFVEGNPQMPVKVIYRGTFIGGPGPDRAHRVETQSIQWVLRTTYNAARQTLARIVKRLRRTTARAAARSQGGKSMHCSNLGPELRPPAADPTVLAPGVLNLIQRMPSIEDPGASDISSRSCQRPFERSRRVWRWSCSAWWVRRLRVDIIRHHRLTADELALLQFERAGLGTKEIARQLGTTCGSVDSRFQRLIKKLGLPSRKAAARLASEYDLIG